MREAANQHNIFIRTRVCRLTAICCPLRSCRLCTRAGAHIKFKRHQRFAHARARKTMTRRVEMRTMCRTD